MSNRTYNELAIQLRQLPAPGHGDAKQALLQAATLAASSHNTQPWTFHLTGNSILIAPDLTRRCEVVDPDDSHLYKSLGCAAENIVAAAPAYGFATDVRHADGGHIEIGLTPVGRETNSRALAIISERQCTRTLYDGRPLEATDIAELESAGRGSGVAVRLVDASALKESILDLVNEGNRTQLSDPGFRRELIEWIRVNDSHAIETGDGLSGRAAGKPQLPKWLARIVMPVVITPQAQVRTDTKNLRSSAGIAVFIGESDNLTSWIEAGRAYQRFSLRATALGIRNAFINQPIEVRNLRNELHSLLGLSGTETAHLMVRYGRAPLAPYSLRRPVSEVRV